MHNLNNFGYYCYHINHNLSYIISNIHQRVCIDLNNFGMHHSYYNLYNYHHNFGIFLSMLHNTLSCRENNNLEILCKFGSYYLCIFCMFCLRVWNLGNSLGKLRGNLDHMSYILMGMICIYSHLSNAHFCIHCNCKVLSKMRMTVGMRNIEFVPLESTNLMMRYLMIAQHTFY